MYMYILRYTDIDDDIYNYTYMQVPYTLAFGAHLMRVQILQNSNIISIWWCLYIFAKSVPKLAMRRRALKFLESMGEEVRTLYRFAT